MNNYIPVKDNKSLLRDGFSKALLSVDREALSQHRNKRKMMRELIENSTKIVKLEDELNEIKSILQELLKDKV